MNTPAWQDLPSVEHEVERFSTRHVAMPAFPPDLEHQYERENEKRRRRQLTVQGIFALAIYDLFIVGDYLMAPAFIGRALVVRFAIMTPLVLLAAWWLQRSHRAAVREGAVALLCVLGCASVLYLHHGTNLPTVIQAETGVYVVLLAANLLLRLETPYALAATVVCYAEMLLFLYIDRLLPLSQKVTIGGRVFWMCCISMLANYSLAREQRFSWLQQARNRIQRRLLTETNRQLVNLSYTDRLTGLPNRGAYDERLASLWRDALDSHAPLSVVMVDVDYFKSINDAFGHLYGDRVLQRVATLLQQALREETDFVARYGGEEFVVLLPNATAHIAAQVAERIRLLVQVAGSPAMVRGETCTAERARWSTVSCGVSTGYPHPAVDPKLLIEQADAALYRAKQTGRNRVCTATPGPELKVLLRA